MTSRDASNRAGAACIEDLLYKTSRTFALTIPLLPEPLRREVGIAYLLFRIVDTLEDSTEWTAEKQVAELKRFRNLLDDETYSGADRLGADWVATPPLEHVGYLELLSELRGVMEAFGDLQEGARTLIRAHTQRTIDRMATFVDRREGAGPLQLRDVSDLKSYCYAVAGIVGEMLTELFLLDCNELKSVAEKLRRDAPVFGEALQLVNIVKDCDTDLIEGRSYLPEGADRSEVFALARGDLESAGGYIATLQEAGAPRGLVEFCALPVLLACATLERVERDGPGSKLTRPEVTDIIQNMGAAIDAGHPAVPSN
jgi:farnesyl-diphosphate farnesyltransferase